MMALEDDFKGSFYSVFELGYANTSKRVMGCADILENME